jgi:hypothetical protein
MPYRQTRFNRAENAEFVLCLQQLRAEGVDLEISSEWIEPSPDPDRLTLEQIHHTATATIYDLPSSAVAIVLPTRMTVLKAGLLVVDVGIMTPWDDFLLEVIEPGESFVNEHLMSGVLPEPSPTILNRWLRSEVPLRPRRIEGVILAEGWTNLPAECQDEMPVTIKLSIEDERHNQLSFDFEVRVDRNLKRRYEREQKKHFQSIQVPKGGLFEPLQPSMAEPHHERRQAAAGRPGGIGNDLASAAPQVWPSNRSAPPLEEAGEKRKQLHIDDEKY